MNVNTLQLKRALRTALLVLLLSVAGMGKMYASYDFSAVCETGQTLYYNIIDYDNHYVALTHPGDNYEPWGGFTKPTGNIVLPSSVMYDDITYSVTEIGVSGVGTFSGCRGLISVTIPNSVTMIGSGSFFDCSSLASVSIPESSVTGIGGGAFYGCSNLWDFSIPASVTTIDNEAFYGCSSLWDTPWDFFIPESVTRIGKEVFHETGWYYYQPDGILYSSNCIIGYKGDELTGSLDLGFWGDEPRYPRLICDFAFSECGGLTSLTIPNSITSIGRWPFYGCYGITEVHYNATNCADSNSVDSPFYECGGSLIIGENVERIPDFIFHESNFTGSLTIPNSVIEIGQNAFGWCRGFSGDLTIGNSVTEIGRSAFEACSGFTGELVIPNSVTTIGEYAFGGCSGFDGILTIPGSVTTIGQSAFGNCGFMEVHYNATDASVETDYGGSPFRSCTGILVIGENVRKLSEYAFYKCQFAEVHYNATNHQHVPAYSINNHCPFVGCTGALVIGENVENIPSYIFYNNNFSGNLIIPNTVTSIGTYAFGKPNNSNYYNRFTGDLTIPNSVTYIGDYAFYRSGFSGGNLTIPTSITGLYYYSFYCGFSAVYYTGNIVQWCNMYFADDWIYAHNLYIDNELVTDLVIPETVTQIKQYAFYKTSSLTSVTISNTLTLIGNFAFNSCGNLSSVIMMGTTPLTIGTNVFSTSNPDFTIYVPYESLNDYKTANNWRNYEPYIKPMFYPSVSGYASSTSNDKWTFIALPLANETDPATVLNLIAEDGGYDLYQFDQSAAGEEWRNYKANSFNLVNGRGYLYATAVDVNLVIGGDFNEDETKEVSLDYDAGKPFAGWNLVGNPFPVGAYINRSYYVMNATGSGIEPMAISSSIPVPVCTGVMVKAEASGESVTFNRTAPSNRIDLGRLQIELTESTPNRDSVSTGSTTLQDKAIISFNAGDRLEKYVFNKDNARISVPQGGKDLAIACTDKQGEMPLDFRATKNGTYTLSVDVENANVDYLHLIDNLTGADVDLLVSPEYTFDAKTSDYASRFRLVFSVCEDADGNDAPFAFINNGNIIIIGAEADAVLQIVDVLGHVIVSTDVARNISTGGMAKGMYILRLIEGEKVRTQKIVID